MSSLKGRLAVALNNTNYLVICEGNGDGTFAIESTPVVGNNPVWLAAADFNGDGKIDLSDFPFLV